jgi:small subunit ribosomal protein S17
MNSGERTSGPDSKPRGKRKTQIGTVKSHKMNKSITVVVERLVRHPRYDKFVKHETRLHAHDENNEAAVGDVVEVASTRPLSKLKRWRLLRIVRKAETSR